MEFAKPVAVGMRRASVRAMRILYPDPTGKSAAVFALCLSLALLGCDSKVVEPSPSGSQSIAEDADSASDPDMADDADDADIDVDADDLDVDATLTLPGDEDVVVLPDDQEGVIEFVPEDDGVVVPEILPEDDDSGLDPNL